MKCYRQDDSPAQGFRNIVVTESAHPFLKSWWPPGHIIGWEHTFLNEISEFLKAVVEDKPISPSFEDGVYNNKVLDAVLESAEKGIWVNI